MAKNNYTDVFVSLLCFHQVASLSSRFCHTWHRKLTDYAHLFRANISGLGSMTIGRKIMVYAPENHPHPHPDLCVYVLRVYSRACRSRKKLGFCRKREKSTLRLIDFRPIIALPFCGWYFKERIFEKNVLFTWLCQIIVSKKTKPDWTSVTHTSKDWERPAALKSSQTSVYRTS